MSTNIIKLLHCLSIPLHGDNSRYAYDKADIQFFFIPPFESMLNRSTVETGHPDPLLVEFLGQTLRWLIRFICNILFTMPPFSIFSKSHEGKLQNGRVTMSN